MLAFYALEINISTEDLNDCILKKNKLLQDLAPSLNVATFDLNIAQQNYQRCLQTTQYPYIYNYINLIQSLKQVRLLLVFLIILLVLIILLLF